MVQRPRSRGRIISSKTLGRVFGSSIIAGNVYPGIDACRADRRRHEVAASTVVICGLDLHGLAR